MGVILWDKSQKGKRKAKNVVVSSGKKGNIVASVLAVQEKKISKCPLVPTQSVGTRGPRALTIFDPDHSAYEDRWITLGISTTGRLLIVCHTFHATNKGLVFIRIFSSRKVTRKERYLYGR